MAAKIVPIPAHIVSSRDDTGYYNIVNDVNNRIGNISRSGNNMLISNIRLTRIRTVLEETSYNLSTILTSDNINLNSYYRSSKTAPHGMGEMAGYNHLAQPPTYFAAHFTTKTLNIAEDGSNWKVTCPTELRRGERFPAYSGNKLSWDDIKIVAKLYKKPSSAPPLEGDLLQTITVTGVDVTRMFSSTINNISIPVDNVSDDYWLYINAYYTYLTSDLSIGDSIRATLTTVKRYPYDIISGGTLLLPFQTAEIYGFNVKNDAPDTGNSERYVGQFRVKFTYYFNADATVMSNSYGTSSYGIGIYPQDTESITCTFDSQLSGYDTERARSITVYYLKDASWVELDSKTWS